MNATQDVNASLQNGANLAYSSGIPFIGIAGNFGSAASSSRDPGNAKYVLSVGAVNSAETIRDWSGRGPTSDGRIKPDLTEVGEAIEAASNANAFALASFDGTSVAAPFAAGAAVLFRRMIGGANPVDAGQVYAYLIASGNKFGTSINNAVGSGSTRAQNGGFFVWGKTAVSSNVNVNVPVNVPSSTSRVRAGIWWPDGSTHSNIDLRLVRPSGTVHAQSLGVGGVFEATAGVGYSGTWNVRILGTTVTPQVAQIVYYAILVE